MSALRDLSPEALELLKRRLRSNGATAAPQEPPAEAARTSGTLRLQASDVDLFTEASHDRNPLHNDPLYARKSAYGDRIAHGVLSGMAVLLRSGVLQQSDVLQQSGTLRGRDVRSVQMAFEAPLFPEQEYAWEASTRGRSASVALGDGPRSLLKATVQFGEDEPGAPDAAAAPALPSEPSSERGPRIAAAVIGVDDLREEQTITGAYGVDAAAWSALATRWGGAGDRPTPVAVVLLACTYIVGMEVPGERALFQRLEVEWTGAPSTGALAYEASVRGVRTATGHVQLGVRFDDASTGRTVATAQLSALFMPVTPTTTAAAAEALLPRSAALTGKHAVIVGGSRGLGAALSLNLALQGADVTATYARSTGAARALAAELEGAPSRCELVRLDATDSEGAQRLRERLRAEGRGIDVFVLNAAPALRPMALDPAFARRIGAYVQESYAMTSTPLLALLPLVEEAGGVVVAISSEFVEDPPPEWPHYVSAKAAIEGLMRTVASAAPSVRVVVARPPRLQTDLTRVPLGHRQAEPPVVVAASLVRSILEGGEPGSVRVLGPSALTLGSAPSPGSAASTLGHAALTQT
jgi:NAD(P)-dependent dehydrogenase (short-subunit alcohol dehydrogenase family)